LAAPQTPNVGGTCTGCVEPVYDYDRDADAFGGVVITGGYVYRGPDPTLQGKYLFLDSRNSNGVSDDNYWILDPANPRGTVQNIDTLLSPGGGSRQFPVSFGEDAAGNLYVAYLVSGEVFRIVANQVPEPAAALLIAHLAGCLLYSSRRRVRTSAINPKVAKTAY
jgi:hypothetical protein